MTEFLQNTQIFTTKIPKTTSIHTSLIFKIMSKTKQIYNKNTVEWLKFKVVKIGRIIRKLSVINWKLI